MKTKLKMKVGDLAIVVDELHGHSFEMGEIVEIKKVYLESDPHYQCYSESNYWWLSDSELHQITL